MFSVRGERSPYGFAAASLVPRALWVAAYIRPPLAIVNTAIASMCLPALVALSSVSLALEHRVGVAIAEESSTFPRLFADRDRIFVVVSLCHARSGTECKDVAATRPDNFMENTCRCTAKRGGCSISIAFSVIRSHKLV